MSMTEEVYYMIPDSFHCSEREFNKKGNDALLEAIGNYIVFLETELKEKNEKA
jgi:hypothetical protein